MKKNKWNKECDLYSHMSHMKMHSIGIVRPTMLELKNELEKYANIGNIAEALVKYKENESQLDIQLREFRKKQNEKQSE